MKKTAIKINNLIVKIRKHMILDRVKMTVPSNKITVFVGENGAGKTTTIKCILGLQRFNKGKIKIFTTSNKLSKSRKNLVYVPDKENFLPIKIRTWLIEQASYFLNDKAILNARINKLADDFGFPKEKLNKKITSLSSGLKKIIMIIGALICECKMIIMDEPTEYLDPIMRNNFFRIIKKYQKKGTTFFISTHNLDEIEKYADFLIVIKDHKIRYCNKWKNTTYSMREAYEHYYATNDLSYFTDSYKGDSKSKYLALYKEKKIDKKEYLLLCNGKKI